MVNGDPNIHAGDGSEKETKRQNAFGTGSLVMEENEQ